MFKSEVDRVGYFHSVLAQGNDMAKKLVWDPVAKTIRPIDGGESTPSGLVITPSDMKHSGAKEGPSL
jgi:hypothetical protein